MIRAEHQSARMSKITNDGLMRSGTGCFIAVSIWQQWASKGYTCFTNFPIMFYTPLDHMNYFCTINCLLLSVHLRFDNYSTNKYDDETYRHTNTENRRTDRRTATNAYCRLPVDGYSIINERFKDKMTGQPTWSSETHSQCQ